MVQFRIERKSPFKIIGRKNYITRLEQFGRFWRESHENGLIDRLNEIRDNYGCPTTNGTHIGLSCTEEDLENRDFYFYIAVEYPNYLTYQGDLEIHSVDEFDWAIFSKNSTKIDALYDCEMYAFKEWLPSFRYEHAYGPEMEVYHRDRIEFWLPVVEG